MTNTPNPAFDFPVLEELPKQPWVENLSPAARADYEEKRAMAIAETEALLVDQLRTYPGFESVPEEAIQNYAHRRSTRDSDAYEEGQQHGRDFAWQVGQAPRNRHAQFALNVTGNIN